MKKTLAVILSVLFVFSVGLVAASPVVPDSSIPAPSAPQYTVTLIENFYVQPPTTTIDPFSGEVTTDEGYTTEKWDITFKIKNEAYSATVNDERGRTFEVGYLYSIEYKGPYEQKWHSLGNNAYGRIPASDGDETVFVEEVYRTQEGLYFDGQVVPVGGRIDFRVQSVIGHWVSTEPFHEEFQGQTSGWVEKSLILDVGGVQPTQSPTQSASSTTFNPADSPAAPEAAGFDWRDVAIVVLAVVAIGAVFAAVVMRRRPAKTHST